MRANYFVCAESASVDSASNKLSLFNLAEEFSASGFPVMGSAFAVVTSLTRESADPDDIMITIGAALNGKMLFEVPFHVAFEGKPRMRAIANFDGVALATPGELVLYAAHKKKRLGAWTILVVQASRSMDPVIPQPKATVATRPKAPTKKPRKKAGNKADQKSSQPRLKL